MGRMEGLTISECIVVSASVDLHVSRAELRSLHLCIVPSRFLPLVVVVGDLSWMLTWPIPVSPPEGISSHRNCNQVLISRIINHRLAAIRDSVRDRPCARRCQWRRPLWARLPRSGMCVPPPPGLPPPVRATDPLPLGGLLPRSGACLAYGFCDATCKTVRDSTAHTQPHSLPCHRIVFNICPPLPPLPCHRKHCHVCPRKSDCVRTRCCPNRRAKYFLEL